MDTLPETFLFWMPHFRTKRCLTQELALMYIKICMLNHSNLSNINKKYNYRNCKTRAHFRKNSVQIG